MWKILRKNSKIWKLNFLDDEVYIDKTASRLTYLAFEKKEKSEIKEALTKFELMKEQAKFNAKASASARSRIVCTPANAPPIAAGNLRGVDPVVSASMS